MTKLSPDQINRILGFLNRVKIRGAEAPLMMDLQITLNRMLQEINQGVTNRITPKKAKK